MSNWLKAMNPTAPIATEAEAEAAARASAISIFIGVVVGLISVAWTLTHMDAIDAAVAEVGADAATTAAAQAGAQASVWMGGVVVLIQLVFAVVQWRDPKKFIAVLFIVLLALGVVMTAAAPLLSGMAPGMPATPLWQVVLMLAIYAVQLVLHFAGLRGISRLDAMQMAAAR